MCLELSRSDCPQAVGLTQEAASPGRLPNSKAGLVGVDMARFSSNAHRDERGTDDTGSELDGVVLPVPLPIIVQSMSGGAVSSNRTGTGTSRPPHHQRERKLLVSNHHRRRLEVARGSTTRQVGRRPIDRSSAVPQSIRACGRSNISPVTTAFCLAISPWMRWTGQLIGSGSLPGLPSAPTVAAKVPRLQRIGRGGTGVTGLRKRGRR